MLEIIIENKVIILGALLGISECLALIPGLKSNGILDGAIKLLKKFLGR